MTSYESIISAATGVSDPAEVAEIEDTMRHVIFHSTLDWQTRAQLEQGAREAKDVVDALRDPAVRAALLAEQGWTP